MQTHSNHHRKIGLALGCGGSKGLAHVGIIKILEENHIPIDYIAGTSSGALIGGIYAANKDISFIENMALNNNWPQILRLFFDPTLGSGLIKGNKINNFLEKAIGQIEFRELKIPFSAVVTDLSTGDPMAISSGEVALAIRASSSLPIIFNPVQINDKLYADGGLSMPVPVEIVKQMGANFVIAVNLSEDYEGIKPTDNIRLINLTSKTTNIVTRKLARENVKQADFVVYPKTGKFGIFDQFFTRKGSEAAILAGETAMNEAMPELIKILNIKPPSYIEKFLTRLKNFFT